MNLLIASLYVALTCLIAACFIIVIIIFGNIFLFLLSKKDRNKWELTHLEYILISFAIGISIYLSYAYILDIFQFFNFYSAYRVFLLIDSCFLVYLFKNNNMSLWYAKIKEIYNM